MILQRLAFQIPFKNIVRSLPQLPYRNRAFFLLAMLLLLGLSSCKSVKRVTDIESVSTRNLIELHEKATPEFKTLAAKVQLAYETEEKSQRITVSLRMEKDKAIWIKASILGITLAKVMITPEKVGYYETIGKTYFEGDFAFLGEWLGTPIDFQQAQDLLLGQSIFHLEPSKYTSEIYQQKFKIQPKRQPQNFIHSLFINPGNYKVAVETLAQPLQDRILNIRYGDYQMVNSQYFPVDISIITSEEQAQTKIDMIYKKIDLNVDISFPFDIPEGYERIQL